MCCLVANGMLAKLYTESGALCTSISSNLSILLTFRKIV
jgi:hypothetical protein